MSNPLEVFKKECPELQKSYEAVIKVLINSNSLEAKTKQLIYIAMKVVSDDSNAIKYHVPMAKAAGASREEIRYVIAMSITVTGLKGISKYLPEALNAFDNC